MRNPLRDWRDRGHVTQRDAAKRLGVSINTLINWETDSAVPDKGHRRVIAGVLGIDLSEVKTWIDKVEGIVTEDVNHE